MDKNNLAANAEKNAMLIAELQNKCVELKLVVFPIESYPYFI